MALAGAGGVAVLTAGTDRWTFWPMVVIAVFRIASDLTYVEAASSRLRVSGSGLGLMLAAVLLGGGPAALFGVLAISVGWLRSREPMDVFRNNLATYAWFPLIAGLFFHVTTRLAHVGSHELGFYLLVFAAFILALVINFIAIAGYQTYVDESSLADKTREALVALLASELFSVLGHHYGDVLLRDLGSRLVEAIGLDGVVARLGGDEFALLPAQRTDDPSRLRSGAGLSPQPADAGRRVRALAQRPRAGAGPQRRPAPSGGGIF